MLSKKTYPLKAPVPPLLVQFRARFCKELSLLSPTTEQEPSYPKTSPRFFPFGEEHPQDTFLVHLCRLSPYHPPPSLIFSLPHITSAGTQNPARSRDTGHIWA